MLASQYQRNGSNIAGAILVSTVLSIVTISVLVTWFSPLTP